MRRRRTLYRRRRQRRSSRGSATVPQKRTLASYGYSLSAKKDARRAALRRVIVEKGSGTVYWLLEDQISEIEQEKARISLKKLTKLTKLNNDQEWLNETYKPRLAPFEAIRSWKQMNEPKRKSKGGLN